MLVLFFLQDLQHNKLALLNRFSMKLIVAENVYAPLGLFVTFLGSLCRTTHSTVKVQWQRSCSECLHLSSTENKLAIQQRHYLNEIITQLLFHV